ncbi:molybdopterin-dependent oxidoreductase [Nocardioides insulae]|uniref:molybdopterin-dependent oxidoreductase n=1 Tax=Nocardioides insulae TaxID=394734 RepID=UPI0005628D20|nr:molybdopterin-dependent oxidoreductase [Nocardioides insulae]
MTTSRAGWAWAGAVAGVTGLAASYLTASLLGVRSGPVVAVAEQIVAVLPGALTEFGIGLFGTADKPVMIALILTAVILLTAQFGRLRARSRARSWLGYAALAAVGAVAVLGQTEAPGPGLVAILVGLVVWIGVLEVLVGLLPEAGAVGAVGAVGRGAEAPDPELLDGDLVPDEGAGVPTRRGFLIASGVLGVGSVVATVFAAFLTGRRRTVEESRRLLSLDGVTPPKPPKLTDFQIDAQPRWSTPVEEFYRIDTAFSPPVIDPEQWRLRIHGMVDRELEFSFADLMELRLDEAWLTLNCVSNEVGGDLIGNAWWSGVRIAPLLAQAGVQAGADGVLQTSEDGWTCLTPLDALTDDRAAMLAVAMNGEPLTIEHGFPVRMIVPGLYGYVSATKWIVDLEVTRFDGAQGYWTDKGWSAHGPVKIGSRIDVPRSNDHVGAGSVTLAGTAWRQHVGIERVEVQIDGGPWTVASLGRAASADTWVQWRLRADLGAGTHHARVRAVGADGEVQTGVERSPAPDGATGWHAVEFEVV